VFPDNQSEYLFDYLFPPLHVYYIIMISDLHAPESVGYNELFSVKLLDSSTKCCYQALGMRTRYFKQFRKLCQGLTLFYFLYDNDHFFLRFYFKHFSPGLGCGSII
jgi:hypothetical protein